MTFSRPPAATYPPGAGWHEKTLWQSFPRSSRRQRCPKPAKLSRLLRCSEKNKDNVRGQSPRPTQLSRGGGRWPACITAGAGEDVLYQFNQTNIEIKSYSMSKNTILRFDERTVVISGGGSGSGGGLGSPCSALRLPNRSPAGCRTPRRARLAPAHVQTSWKGTRGSAVRYS